MPRARANDVLFISKSNKSQLDLLKNGQRLREQTGYSIDALCRKAVTDRLELASGILKHARNCYNLDHPPFRTIISRSYYSMYHTARAMSFYVNPGDDNQEHNKLPQSFPDDFPEKAYWANQLKAARYERNRSDYDPYPKNENTLKETADTTYYNAKKLLSVTRNYLRSKGWRP